MNDGRGPHLLIFESRQSSWLERALYAIGGVVVIVIGFFFLTMALIAGALLALVIVARLWWISRKLRRAGARHVVEGEYEVVERSDSGRAGNATGSRRTPG
jgi:membrane protein YdbS with pleckstrin-like domain